MVRACVACAAVVCLLLAASCQGGGGAAAAQAKRDPGELGIEIGDTYLKMVDEVGATIAAGGDPVVLHPLIDALKEKYVAAFVALGKQREEFQPNDRASCDDTAQTRMRKVTSEALDAISTMAAAVKETDPDLAKHFTELQRLTRYTTFEQLRSQSPDEAARLGIR
jgi:hypothetical protein